MKFKLMCAGCGELDPVRQWDGSMWHLCPLCKELADKWMAESQRDMKALAEERLSSPRYAGLRALLTASSEATAKGM